MVTFPPFSNDPRFLAGTPWALTPPRRNLDWLYAVVLVTALAGAGALFSSLTRIVFYQYTFTFRLACVYVPVAAVIILFAGYARFPLAAALFYGCLPIAQAAHAGQWLAGDWNAALTFEMVLAVPLVLMGLAGPSAAAPGTRRHLPGALQLTFIGILGAALLSTLMAKAPGVAAMNLLGRFVVPIAVTFAAWRRLRSVDEYRTAWFGMIVGMALDCIYQYRRGVLGELEFAEQYSQRSLGISQSFAIPMLYLAGGQLWFGLARTRPGTMFQAIAMLILVAVFGLLMWLGAARGPLVFLGLLLAWWFVRLLGQVRRPGALLVVLLGGVIVVYLLRYSLGQTGLDVRLVIDRFAELRAEGFAGHDRAYVWNRAVEFWKTSPLWGIGLNNWTVYNDEFESAHSLFYGLLCDMGVFGIVVFGAFFAQVLLLTRKRFVAALAPDDRTFFYGCRAGWIVMLLCMVTNLPFTSGQARNQIFAHMVYFFPLLVMLVYSRGLLPELVGGPGSPLSPVLRAPLPVGTAAPPIARLP